MKILNTWQLRDDFSISSVDVLDREIIQDQAKKYLASEYPMLPKNYGLEAQSIDKLRDLKSNLKQQYALRLAIFHKDNLIGWTDGWQDSVEQDSFFMGASLILPEFQRQGLYSSLVNKVLEMTKEAGFQSIWSLHVMANNPVLIAKLKLDFHIYGFEVNTRYGALVRLVYHHSEMKRRALKFRAGAVHDTVVIQALRA